MRHYIVQCWCTHAVPGHTTSTGEQDLSHCSHNYNKPISDKINYENSNFWFVFWKPANEHQSLIIQYINCIHGMFWYIFIVWVTTMRSGNDLFINVLSLIEGNKFLPWKGRDDLFFNIGKCYAKVFHSIHTLQNKRQIKVAQVNMNNLTTKNQNRWIVIQQRVNKLSWLW